MKPADRLLANKIKQTLKKWPENKPADVTISVELTNWLEEQIENTTGNKYEIFTHENDIQLSIANHFKHIGYKEHYHDYTNTRAQQTIHDLTTTISHRHIEWFITTCTTFNHASWCSYMDKPIKEYEHHREIAVGLSQAKYGLNTTYIQLLQQNPNITPQAFNIAIGNST